MPGDSSYVLDMLEMARLAIRHADALTREEFDRNRLLQDGLVREIQVLGEAARKVSAELRAASPEIPWSKIVGMRNVLVHDYIEVDLDEIWRVAREDLPALIPHLERLAPSPSE